MSPPSLSSETLHVSAVAIDGRAVLIGGRSGTGKSDLALRLIDRGAALISDDYTFIHRVRGRALACAPATIKGKIEVRGVGIIEREPVADIPVALFVDLDGQPQRLPGGEERIECLLLTLLPLYLAGEKPYVRVAFGCTGGRHRSVHVAEGIAARLRAAGFSPNLVHRDLAAPPRDGIERSARADGLQGD